MAVSILSHPAIDLINATTNDVAINAVFYDHLLRPGSLTEPSSYSNTGDTTTTTIKAAMARQTHTNNNNSKGETDTIKRLRTLMVVLKEVTNTASPLHHRLRTAAGDHSRVAMTTETGRPLAMVSMMSLTLYEQ